MLISPMISVSAPKVACLEDEVAVRLSEMDRAKADEEVPCGGGAIKPTEPVKEEASATDSVVDWIPDLTTSLIFRKRKDPPATAIERKIVKKRVMVTQEAIDMLLLDPPSDPIDPADYDNIPEECKTKFSRAHAFLNKMKMEQRNVLSQYDSKGYAEIYTYRYQDDEEAE